MLGREWIEPNEWVDVQFGIVSAAMGLASLRNAPAIGDKTLTVHLWDGSNRTIVAPAFNESHAPCSSMFELGGSASDKVA